GQEIVGEEVAELGVADTEDYARRAIWDELGVNPPRSHGVLVVVVLGLEAIGMIVRGAAGVREDAALAGELADLAIGRCVAAGSLSCPARRSGSLASEDLDHPADRLRTV